MDKKTEEFVNSVKALGETAGVLLESLIENGFRREEAVQITNIFILETLRNSQRRSEEF